MPGIANRSRSFKRTAALAVGALALAVVAAGVLSSLLESDDAPEAVAEREIMDLTDTVRNANGLPSLVSQPALVKAARDLAAALARGAPFEHVDAQGQGPKERATRAGYGPSVLVIENLASGAGEPDARTILASWLASPPHRENLISGEVTDTGVACASSGAGGFVCVHASHRRMATIPCK